METTEEVLEVTDPEAAQLIVKLGALQVGDLVRFSKKCDAVVSIPRHHAGEWHRIERDGNDGWRSITDGWCFSSAYAEAIDGWRRVVKRG